MSQRTIIEFHVLWVYFINNFSFVSYFTLLSHLLHCLKVWYGTRFKAHFEVHLFEEKKINSEKMRLLFTLNAFYVTFTHFKAFYRRLFSWPIRRGFLLLLFLFVVILVFLVTKICSLKCLFFSLAVYFWYYSGHLKNRQRKKEEKHAKHRKYSYMEN